MGKQNNGINGGYQGTVGTAIGYNWRGRWCTRSKPSATKDPCTTRQVAARGWFTASVQLASHMRLALRQGLHDSSLAQHMTEDNYFIRLNRPHLGWQDGALVVDYGSLVVAEGPVTPVHFGVVTSPEAHVLTATFSTDPADGCSAYHDTVHLFAYCPEAMQGVMATPVYRSAERVTVTTPRPWGDSEVWLYGWVQDIDGHCSGSVCLAEP